MSSRQVKRAVADRLGTSEATGPAPRETDGDCDDEARVAAPPRAAGFAALLSSSDDEARDSTEDEEVPGKPHWAHASSANGFGSPGGDSTPVPPHDCSDGDDAHSGEERARVQAPLPAAGSRNQRHQERRQQAETAASMPGNDETVSASMPSSQQTTTDSAVEDGPGCRSYDAHSVMQLQQQHLDVTNELNKTFGRATLRKLVAAERNHRGGRGPQPPGARGGAGTRFWFGRPRDHWPQMRSGLEMEALSNASAGRGREARFAFVQSRAYREAQQELEVCVASGDPNALVRLLQAVPYMVDALVRFAEYCQYTGQHELGAEMVEKALYACENAFHPLFRARCLEGTARLPWSEPANRPFFRALQRHAQALSRRGCSRTAFEVAKLLFSLDPSEDPMLTLQQLDFFALQAQQSDWVLSMPRALTSMSLPLYPNWAFSLALAMRSHVGERRAGASDAPAAEAEEAAAEQLERALLLFPAALPLLVRRVAADSVPATMLSQRWEDGLAAQLQSAPSARPASEDDGGATLGKLLRLFVERNFTVWREASAYGWLVSVAERVLERLNAGEAGQVLLVATCAAVRAAEYGGPAATYDEFASADPADFSVAIPAQVPADLQAFAADDDGQPGRPARLPGRLVVPREECLQLSADTNAFLQFFLSLIPWAMPPAR